MILSRRRSMSKQSDRKWGVWGSREAMRSRKRLEHSYTLAPANDAPGPDTIINCCLLGESPGPDAGRSFFSRGFLWSFWVPGRGTKRFCPENTALSGRDVSTGLALLR